MGLSKSQKGKICDYDDCEIKQDLKQCVDCTDYVALVCKEHRGTFNGQAYCNDHLEECAFCNENAEYQCSACKYFYCSDDGTTSGIKLCSECQESDEEEEQKDDYPSVRFVEEEKLQEKTTPKSKAIRKSVFWKW